MYIYRNEVKIIAITYILASFAILDIKIAITCYPVIVSTSNIKILRLWKSILNKMAKILFVQLFLLLYILISQYNGRDREFFKYSNWNMLKTPSKMNMYDMVKIDTKVFEIVGLFNIFYPSFASNNNLVMVILLLLFYPLS